MGKRFTGIPLNLFGGQLRGEKVQGNSPEPFCGPVEGGKGSGGSFGIWVEIQKAQNFAFGLKFQNSNFAIWIKISGMVDKPCG